MTDIERRGLVGVERIAITGNSGSGKSTLAVALGRSLGFPVVHHDQLYWRRDGSACPLKDFEPQLRQVLSEERWVFEGFHKETESIVFSRAQLVIVLDVPRWVCVWRLVAGFGRRPGLPVGSRMRRFGRRHWSFLRWVWIFPTDRRPGLMAAVRTLAGDRVIVIRSGRQARSLVRGVKAA